MPQRKSQSNRKDSQVKRGTGSEEKETEDQGDSRMEEDSAADIDEESAVSKKKRNKKSYSVGKIKNQEYERNESGGLFLR